MAQYTQYVTLDSLIREMCANEGDTYGHTYMQKLSHAVAFIRDCDHSGLHFKGVKYLWLPVVEGRASVPDLVGISRVGVEIGGHIQVLLEDLNMLDRRNDCGGFTTDRPVNPDIPSVRSTGQLPTLFTGGMTGGGYGYGWGGAGAWGYGWGYNGYSWGGWDMTWPGMGVKKSVYGYYRHFASDGYILLDADSNWDTIVLECAVKTFTPGSVTLLPEVCAEALMAYIRWAVNRLDAEVATKARPLIGEMQREKSRTKLLLRQRVNAQPLHELWAVLR